MLLLVLCLELLILSFLSRLVTQGLFEFFLLIFRARSVAISLILLLEFPGTVVHELSHLFTAEILRVPTGKLTLVPESIRENSIQPGSVMIAQTDPFRRYAIGLAPLFSGMFLLTAISLYFPRVASWGEWSTWGYIGLGYLLFAISNTMFPSPADTKGFWPFAIAVVLFGGIGYMLGIRLEIGGQAQVYMQTVLLTLTKNAAIVAGLNIVILFVVYMCMKGISAITRKRIIPG